jgi:multiple sugar transport system substrate-binding protein
VKRYIDKIGPWIVWEVLVVVFCSYILRPALTGMPVPSPVADPSASSGKSEAVAAASTPIPTVPTSNCPAASTGAGKVQIQWFIGLGAGSNPEQIAIEQSVVDDFNRSQDRIELSMEAIPNETAKDVLAGRFGGSDGPDIVGPVGWAGAGRFTDQWMDLSLLMECNHTSTDIYNPVLVDMYHTAEGQISLPFLAYPSAMFFNKDLFDESGLYYPPEAYGMDYTMPDGTKVEWNWDTVAEVAKRLTWDSAGRNANNYGFDSQNVIQYGFTWQWENHVNYMGSFWADGSLVAPGGGPGHYAAQVPDAWRAAWNWTYDGIWGSKPFIPSESVDNDSAFGEGNPFNSGKIAMTIQPIWYTCCMWNFQTWELAALPKYNGQVGGRIDADTFRIWKNTRHPQEAYIALQYLLNNGMEKLVIGTSGNPSPYGGISARTADQNRWVEQMKVQYPWVRNWQVVLDGLNYADIPSAEGFMPNYSAAWDRGTAFSSLLRGESGLDINAEIDKFQGDLTVIFNQD